jgi:hypothetical protein
MKKSILLTLLISLITSLLVFSQTDRNECRLIIEIDGKLPVGCINNASLKITNKADSVIILSARYEPGTLFFNSKNASVIIDSAKKLN